MNSSLSSMVFRAPRTFYATSAELRCSNQFDSSKIDALKASLFSYSFESRVGSRSEFGTDCPLWSYQRSTCETRVCS